MLWTSPSPAGAGEWDLLLHGIKQGTIHTHSVKLCLMCVQCTLNTVFPSSLPTEVCTVVSDANCVMPVKTICNPVPATPDCQLVLRQFFNDSGIFCVNVSMTNDVSLAVTSTRVSVNMGMCVWNPPVTAQLSSLWKFSKFSSSHCITVYYQYGTQGGTPLQLYDASPY